MAENTCPRDLTSKQRRFVAECLTDLNGTQAAIRAGYSPKTAKSIGHENLTKPDIAAAIKKEQGQTRERLQIDRDWVLLKLHFHATVMLQSGQSPVLVSKRLGHAKVSTTLDLYAHALPGWQKDAADAFAKAMEQG